MKDVDTGQEKVQRICEILKKETLEPAKQEADQIVAKAKQQADQILQQAKSEAEKLKTAGLQEIEREKAVFQSSLNQACKQSLSSLKEEIEQKMFHQELYKLIQAPLNNPKVIAELIEAVVRAIEKEGTEADLDVVISKSFSAKEINENLLQQTLSRLKEKTVSLGSIKGGIEVKICKENIIIDATDEAIKELVAKYIRKDFCNILFRTKD